MKKMSPWPCQILVPRMVYVESAGGHGGALRHMIQVGSRTVKRTERSGEEDREAEGPAVAWQGGNATVGHGRVAGIGSGGKAAAGQLGAPQRAEVE